jgi:hypothetical protein
VAVVGVLRRVVGAAGDPIDVAHLVSLGTAVMEAFYDFTKCMMLGWYGEEGRASGLCGVVAVRTAEILHTIRGVFHAI